MKIILGREHRAERQVIKISEIDCVALLHVSQKLRRQGIQGVEIQPGSPNGHPKIVLDGQQRLTSLYKALKEKGKEPEVYFHLGNQQFQLYLSRLKADPLWISVRDVFNNRKSDLKLLREIE